MSKLEEHRVGWMDTEVSHVEVVFDQETGGCASDCVPVDVLPRTAEFRERLAVHLADVMHPKAVLRFRAEAIGRYRRALDAVLGAPTDD